LINNAAIHGDIREFNKLSNIDSFKDVINVNLMAPIAITKSVLKNMIKNKYGTIINMSGGGAAGLRPNFSQYATSKSALVKFSESIAAELIIYNINVNCISPGPMATNLLNEIILMGPDIVGITEYENALKAFETDGKNMELVARLIIYLSSSYSRGITGKLINAIWDNWSNWHNHLDELNSDLYTLRRVTARDRNFNWGDL
jgi:NAD(P)-dependent dehydrogenase (short-subunit alcohol dehydrogenase family)